MIIIDIEVSKDSFGVKPICPVPGEHGVAIAPSTQRSPWGPVGLGSGLDDAHMADTLPDILWTKPNVWREIKLRHETARQSADLGDDKMARLMTIVAIHRVPVRTNQWSRPDFTYGVDADRILYLQHCH